jgi:uncharacterized paraquat-inducible protein A
MLICSDCSAIMRCTKTGCDVVYNNMVVNRADEFQCPTCKKKVRNCRENPQPLFSFTTLEMPLYIEEK